MKFKQIFYFLLLAIVSSASYAQQLTRKEIAEITEKIPDLISENYVLKEKSDEITSKFKNELSSKKYLSITNPDSLAKTLTKDLRAISNDKHLYVKYYQSSPEKDEFDWDAWEKEERILEIRQNFGFTEVKILPDNIGYIKIVEFMHPQRGMPTAVAAMKLVEHTDGLIIDIRDNGGGYGGLMNYVLNYYFDGGPTHISTTIYSDEEKLPDKEYSSDLVYGKLRVNTPLYIITNEKTGSAAEFFAYTLLSFGKAKIIGQPTAGAAHMNTFYPLNENFRISISTGAPINSKTNTNWENTGVIPNQIVEENAIDKAWELIKTEVSTVAVQ